jgi:hypothetical protein
LPEPYKFVFPCMLTGRVRCHGCAPLGGKFCCGAGNGKRRLRTSKTPASTELIRTTKISPPSIYVEKLPPRPLLLPPLPGWFCGGGPFPPPFDVVVGAPARAVGVWSAPAGAVGSAVADLVGAGVAVAVAASAGMAVAATVGIAVGFGLGVAVGLGFWVGVGGGEVGGGLGEGVVIGEPVGELDGVSVRLSRADSEGL